MEPDPKVTMEEITRLPSAGLYFQSSEIYGGLNGFWDYGRSERSSSATSRTHGGAIP